MRGGLRIAMWSGPRNISTAMMRAWENRPDTVVWDEPFYAYYLCATGLDHPVASEVIAHGETDWRRVVEAITGPIPGGATVFFQKHMTHHLLDEVDRGWLDEVANCFLIREPREVIASYARARPGVEVTMDDVGIERQTEIYRHVRRAGGEPPPVLDARDVLENPRGVLQRLCARLGVEFSERMLHWPAGPRPSDGVWAKHWYENVRASTGFAPYTPAAHGLPRALEPLAEACAPYYRELFQARMRA